MVRSPKQVARGSNPRRARPRGRSRRLVAASRYPVLRSRIVLRPFVPIPIPTGNRRTVRVGRVTACRELFWGYRPGDRFCIKGSFDNLDHVCVGQGGVRITSTPTSVDAALRCSGCSSRRATTDALCFPARGSRQPTRLGDLTHAVGEPFYSLTRFDSLMVRAHPFASRFEAYCDDVVVHCDTHEQACRSRDAISGRCRVRGVCMRTRPQDPDRVLPGTARRGSHAPARFTFLDTPSGQHVRAKPGK